MIKHKYKGEFVDITDQFESGYNQPTEECNHTDGGCCICNPQLFNQPDKISGAVSSYMLTKLIIEAKRRYYSNGTSKYTDDEYDAIERSLKAIDPDAEVLNNVGYHLELK